MIMCMFLYMYTCVYNIYKTLQHTATHCNTLQHTATYYSGNTIWRQL